MKNRCTNQAAHMIAHHVVEDVTNTPVRLVYFSLCIEIFAARNAEFFWDVYNLDNATKGIIIGNVLDIRIVDP